MSLPNSVQDIEDNQASICSGMKTYAALCCYFGPLPCWFQLWLTSCKYNPAIDFFFITDSDLASYSIPDNVIVINYSFTEVKSLISSKRSPLCSDIDYFSVINRPYKLCDFRPSYGFVFKDIFDGYTYWGWFDIDTIWGDIISFIPSGTKWLKIFPCGHLSFVLNVEPYDRAFEMINEKDSHISWKEAFSTTEAVFFDEHNGMHPLFKRPEFFDQYYRKADFDNIRPPQWTNSRSFQSIDFPEKNHFLCFQYNQGHMYRNYLSGLKVKKEEVSYIHFSKRKVTVNCSDPLADRFVFYPNQFRDWRRFSALSLIVLGGHFFGE